MSETNETQFTVTPGGAKRSKKVPMYRGIPFCFIKRTAEAFSEGNEKYNEAVFDSNWKRGREQFFAEAFDHTIDHLFAWFTLINDPSQAEMMELQEEDNLGHAAAGLAFLMYGEEMGWFTKAADKNAPELTEVPLVGEDVTALIPVGLDVEEVTDDEGGDEVEQGPKKTFSSWLKGSLVPDIMKKD